MEYPTLLDVTRRLDPDGSIAAVAEILEEDSEILDDMPWMEGNLPTGHRHTVRSGLPEPTWRKLNYGVQPTKGRTIQVTDSCGMLEDYAEVDKALADLNGNTNAFRLSEDRAHIQGISHELARAVIYGDSSTDPEQIMGLAPRFNDLSAESADNIILGDGSGSDNTSIWLVGWGDRSAFGIYPKGSKAGLSVTDKGQVTLEDDNRGRYEGYRTHYKWDCGLTVRDWRYVVRIANIDISNLNDPNGTPSTRSDLVDLMVQALERIQGMAGVRPAFYCNRTVRSALRRQILGKQNLLLSLDEVAGKKVLSFDSVPVRRVDAILDTEAAVA